MRPERAKDLDFNASALSGFTGHLKLVTKKLSNKRFQFHDNIYITDNTYNGKDDRVNKPRQHIIEGTSQFLCTVLTKCRQCVENRLP